MYLDWLLLTLHGMPAELWPTVQSGKMIMIKYTTLTTLENFPKVCREKSLERCEVIEQMDFFIRDQSLIQSFC